MAQDEQGAWRGRKGGRKSAESRTATVGRASAFCRLSQPHSPKSDERQSVPRKWPRPQGARIFGGHEGGQRTFAKHLANTARIRAIYERSEHATGERDDRETCMTSRRPRRGRDDREAGATTARRAPADMIWAMPEPNGAERALAPMGA